MVSSIASATDALGVAETLARIRTPGAGRLFETLVFSARGVSTVRTSSGIGLDCLPRVPDALDVVLVPAIMHASADELDTRTWAMAPEVEALRRLHARGVAITAACTGVWLLAQTGLLNGLRATTSWWLGAAFRQRFPGVKLDHEAILVEDGDILTGGASSAVIDIVMRLIDRHAGPELAHQTGCILLADPQRRSQAPFVDLALMERPRHSLSERARRFLRDNLHREVGVAELAAHCDVSERTLLRHFRGHFGRTPHEYLQQVRVERAKALLETTLLSFEEIVERCGYRDVSSFRKLFKRRVSRTPADYRERFRLRA